jgi:N-sulfoglucosamine sulfohydrolase
VTYKLSGYVCWCLATLCIAIAPAIPTRAAERPNILLLMAEDMSARVSAFGDEVAVTPNIDRLASEGIRYPNTFTTAGVCAPSRAAHIMGMHQISFGAQHMRTTRGPLGTYKSVPPPQAKAYPELLRAAGYYTWTNHKLDYQFSGPMAHSGPFTIWDAEGRDGHWRHRQSGQPFYGLINFDVTHESGVFPPLGNAPNSAIHAVLQAVRAATQPSVQGDFPVRPEQVILPPYYPDTPTVRADVARHYNNIAAMDQQVGDILAQLKADGLLDSTIVVWTTDHGDGLPRAKRELFDSGIKVPMIIRWPKNYRPQGVAANGIDTRLVSFIDLAPTLLRLAGAPVPDYMQGRDLVTDPPRQYIYASRDRIDEVQDRQRAVRDKRYKLIRSWHPEQPGGHRLAFRDNMAMMRELWRLLEAGELDDLQQQWFEPPGEERLFDLQTDPFELHNLADDPAHKDTLRRMNKALLDWQGRVEDWSEQTETEMLAGFRPKGVKSVTPLPDLTFAGGKFHLANSNKGASLGYQIDAGPWLLYTRPIAIPSGTTVQGKAVRYGWEDSASVSRTAP